MGDDAVDDVGDRLEAAVGMPRCADGLVRCVLHRAELVEQEEGVGDVRVDATGERAPHLEAGALDRVLRGHDAVDRPGDGVGLRRGEAGQDQWVLDGDRRHALCNTIDTASISRHHAVAGSVPEPTGERAKMPRSRSSEPETGRTEQ